MEAVRYGGRGGKGSASTVYLNMGLGPNDPLYRVFHELDHAHRYAIGIALAYSRDEEDAMRSAGHVVGARSGLLFHPACTGGFGSCGYWP